MACIDPERCTPDEPCPECAPCVVPQHGRADPLDRLRHQIRCGWPADQCPPGSVELVWTPPRTVNPGCDASVYIMPGDLAIEDDCDGIDTTRVTIHILRAWPGLDASGNTTDLIEAERLQLMRQLFADYGIMRQLVAQAPCAACLPGPLVELGEARKVTSSTTTGWAIDARLT